MENLSRYRDWVHNPNLIDLSRFAEEVGLSYDDIDLEGSKFFHSVLAMSNGDVVFEGDDLTGYFRHEAEELLLGGQLIAVQGCYDIDFTLDALYVAAGKGESVIEAVDSAISDAIEQHIDDEKVYWNEIDRTNAML